MKPEEIKSSDKKKRILIYFIDNDKETTQHL